MPCDNCLLLSEKILYSVCLGTGCRNRKTPSFVRIISEHLGHYSVLLGCIYFNWFYLFSFHTRIYSVHIILFLFLRIGFALSTDLTQVF